jgi:hypothetical protein
LLVAVRFANKKFEDFELSGPDEFQASVVLLARALGAGHKVAGHGRAHREAEVLSDDWLTELAYAAQAEGLLHRLGPDMQCRTNGEDLCAALADAIKLEAKGLGLHVEEELSRSTVSRYLTISRASENSLAGGSAGTGAVPLEVRISDHGASSNRQRIDLRLNDDVAPVLARMRQQFGRFGQVEAPAASNCVKEAAAPAAATETPTLQSKEPDMQSPLPPDAPANTSPGSNSR